MKKSGVAVHPKTGKQIKVMTLDGQSHKDQKTLIWVKNQEELAAVKGRWQSVSFEEDLDATYKIKGDSVTIGTVEFKFNEIIEAYPFLGNEWNGTAEDAVLLVCGLLRFQRLVGYDYIPETCTQTRADLLRSFGVEYLATALPDQLWLIQQYYVPPTEKRAKEIRRCLEKNLACPSIDRIILLNEKEELIKSPKIKESVIGSRLTYRAVIEYIYKEVPEGVRVVFSNSDIWLDDWSKDFWAVDMSNKFFALLRYEATDGKLFGPRADSQDCWVLDSSSVKRRKWDWEALDFPFGQMGCDNAITTEFLRQKFSVTNPCLSLKTFHEHSSEIRNYERTDIVKKYIFFYVDPSGIHDMEIYTDLSSFQSKSSEGLAFERRIRSADSAGLKTWVTMMNRQEGQAWSVDSENSFKEKAELTYKMKNVFATNNGLLYDYDGIYTGPSEDAKRAWSETVVHPLTPLTSCERFVTVPVSKADLFDYSGGFVLKYLSRVLALWSQGERGDFWIGNSDAVNWMRLFEWNTGKVNALPYADNNGAYVADAVWSGIREGAAIYKKDINILRSALKGWEKRPGSGRTVSWGAKCWHSLETTLVHTSTHTPSEIANALIGADELLYLSSDPCNYCWMMPIGAKVIEVLEELAPRHEGVHLSGASGLEHWMIFRQRGLAEIRAKKLDEWISLTRSGWTKRVPAIPSSPADNLPVLILPECSTQGFFGHAGDTFRELALMWAEAGFVKIVKDPRATLCWFGEIGKILLYDRPTLHWLEKAPLAEKGWQLGLFGNPVPPTGGKPWIFWGRRPQLLEACIPLGWEERKRGMVFYGKCENSVQTGRREGDWAAICDEFSMPIGATANYKMSQEDYLSRLGEARWGLCLPGYGWKCNREIECLALGTVPVCLKGVDMDSYAEPLIDGVHYIRIENASSWVEPKKEKWIEMSEAGRAWWKRNGSCAGSFKKTMEIIRNYKI